MDYISAINTLEVYKKLADNEDNHRQLLKEKTVILYVATLLDCKNKEVLCLCLDVLESIAKNNRTHEALSMTFGIIEALESLSIKLRHTDYSVEAQRAAELSSILRNALAPAYNTRSKVKNKSKSLTFVYLLHIDKLTVENRHLLDETLVNTEGIISFVIDIERCRCAVRVGPKLSIKSLVLKIHTTCRMKPYLVTCNSDKIEEGIDIHYKHIKIIKPDDHKSKCITDCEDWFDM